MSTPQVVVTDAAPGAVGPYSQALILNNLIFVSGQLPLDPLTKAMSHDIKNQTAVCLTNIKNILHTAGSDLTKVIKATVYLADIIDFPAMNEIYATFFQMPFPARSCFAVKDLPLGARVEIEVIAAV